MGMALTLAAKLDSVQAAITAIEGGAQSFTIGQRTYTRPDIDKLYDREAQLLAQINRADQGGRRVAEF